MSLLSFYQLYEEGCMKISIYKNRYFLVSSDILKHCLIDVYTTVANSMQLFFKKNNDFSLYFRYKV